jgi:GNAT superfamily N-acetyltransferase
VIRELAENPNVHQLLGPGRELVIDPAGRFAVYLGTDRGPHAATVQRVRLRNGEVEAAVAEIRALLRTRGYAGAEWELGESSTPADLVAQLESLGIHRDESEPVAVGMVLRGPLDAGAAADVDALAVRDADELLVARRVMREAFGGDPADEDAEQAGRDMPSEGVTGSTFLAFVDGTPAGAGYASYTPHGLLLFGGAVLPAYRRRGAYRALVAARAAEAASRGTPVLVTHAGRMSRPILERIGFEPVARIERLLDEFEDGG